MSKYTGYGSMDIAMEIFSSVFGYFPTTEAYESMTGVDAESNDADILILNPEFMSRDENSAYTENKVWKNPEMAAWQFGNKKYHGRPVEQTYWAFNADRLSAVMRTLSIPLDLYDGLLKIVVDNGKEVFLDPISEKTNNTNTDPWIPPNFIDNIQVNAETKSLGLNKPAAPFVYHLVTDTGRLEYYKYLLVPLPEGINGPIKFGKTYDDLQLYVRELERLGMGAKAASDITEGNLYHAVMQFPIWNGFTYQGYIAVMPYGGNGIISFSNMALLEITEVKKNKSNYNSRLKMSFGEDAFKAWGLLKPEYRHQSINKKVISEL